MKKEIQFLRKKADEAEANGLANFVRSANHAGIGYTEFSNARDWGDRARFYREAARELEKEFGK